MTEICFLKNFRKNSPIFANTYNRNNYNEVCFKIMQNRIFQSNPMFSICPTFLNL